MKTYKFNYKDEQYKITGVRGEWKAYINLDGFAQRVHEPTGHEVTFKTIREAESYTRALSYCIRENSKSIAEIERNCGRRPIEWERIY